MDEKTTQPQQESANQNAPVNQPINVDQTPATPTQPSTPPTHPISPTPATPNPTPTATVPIPATQPQPQPQVTPQPPAQPQVTPSPAANTVSASPSSPAITTFKPTESPKEKKKSNGIISFAITIIAALLLTQIVNMFFFQSYRVFGSSMDPTLKDGDRLIISKISKTTSKITKRTWQPKRGEIIVFKSPQEDDLQLIKRVIGLPGERVVVKNGKITVYNTDHPDGFNPDDGTDYKANLPEISGDNDVTVPEGEIFVSGDNRLGSNSLDSRNELGTVPEELIVGRNVLRLWPLQTARFF